MTNKLVVIINSLKVPKILKNFTIRIVFLVPNYSCLQNPWLGSYRPQIPVLSVLCPQQGHPYLHMGYELGLWISTDYPMKIVDSLTQLRLLLLFTFLTFYKVMPILIEIGW